ncbi:hypothetical protein FRC20_006241 [Serendipita sp. 405]|nr:hypothetical protein FRC20_006241 [Serendipita sp. 405]
MPPFSRLQLAAALIEYDNDPDDPYAPYRSAESSAIFSFLRNKPDPRHTIMGYDEMPRKSVDYLQVELPNEETPSALAGLPILQQQQQQQQPRKSVDARKSMDRLADGRKTPDGRRSIEPLARPPSELAQWNGTMFRDAEDEFEDEEEPHDMPEVNLASWGVDQFLTKKEEKPRPRSRASSINAYSRAASPGPSLHTLTRPRGTSVSSAHALGANVVPPERGANRRSGGYRTKSMGDWGRDDEHIEQEAVAVPRTSVSSSGRARPTSVADMDYLITNNQPHPPTSFRPRAGSVSALRQSVPFPQEPDPEPEPNPFEIPLESATQTSRFDPKAIAHQRNVSFASMSTRRAFQNAEGDVPDNISMMTGPRQEPTNYNNRYSRADILRPKVLVMPSPLQDQAEARPVQPQRNVRPGFQDSTDARPLPLGARSSTYGGLNVGARSSMTLAQLTFRNSLMVGGQRDPAFADFEDNLRRAQYDGERIEQEMDPEPEVEEQLPYRAAGKLYGRSLIDDLEARKAQLKSKQRVFRGDERPSMMQRPQPRRTGTLISEEDLLQNAMGTGNPWSISGMILFPGLLSKPVPKKGAQIPE